MWHMVKLDNKTYDLTNNQHCIHILFAEDNYSKTTSVFQCNTKK